MLGCKVSGLVFRVEGLRFGVSSLGSRVLGCRVWGLGSWVLNLGFGVQELVIGVGLTLKINCTNRNIVGLRAGCLACRPGACGSSAGTPPKKIYRAHLISGYNNLQNI